MTRDEALEELKLRLSNINVLKHSIAVETIMREFATHYNADVDIWGMAGLLHDIDYERTADNPSLHGIVGADILENLDIDEAIVYSVRAHNDYLDIPRKRKMDKVLFLADSISDLIIKCALILPSQKIADVSVEFVIQKMNEKEYAESINRDLIEHYEEELGITHQEFIEITLNAMKRISIEFELWRNLNSTIKIYWLP